MKTIFVLVLFLPVLLALQCTPDDSNQTWNIFLTDDVSWCKYEAAVESRCLACGMQLCTLPQMKIAFEFGYRNLQFGHYRGASNRKARVTSCDYALPGQECFYEGREILTVPMEDRETVGAYCCPLTHPVLTPDKFTTHPEAQLGCRDFDFQLCPLELLAYLNDRGYYTDEYGWYATKYLQAILSDGEVRVDYNPHAGETALAAYCCPAGSSFILSEARYLTYVQAKAFCESVRLNLCSLAKLKLARDDYGYWSGIWGHYDVDGRDVKVFDCKYWAGDECYEGVIANTPRPANTMKAYCCP